MFKEWVGRLGFFFFVCVCSKSGYVSFFLGVRFKVGNVLITQENTSGKTQAGQYSLKWKYWAILGSKIIFTFYFIMYNVYYFLSCIMHTS